MPLTPRERVLATLNHEEPDRVPIVIGVSNATSMRMKPYRELKRLLGIQAPDKYLYDWPELGTVEVDEETLRRLHVDVRGVWDRHPDWVYERAKQRKPGEPFFDAWGIGQVELSPGSWFPHIHPLADAQSIEDIERYPWPDPYDPSRVRGVRERAEQLAREGQYAIMATPWLLFPFERAIAMRGMERFFMDLVEDPEFAQALLRKVLDICKGMMETFLEALGDNVDIIKIGDDLGTQTSLLISPRMYRRYIKPLHAEYIAFIKERTKAKVFFHTDGDVFPLLDDLVEIGIDILNPVQTSAGRMADLETLKKRYGKNLVFCGAIDTHRVLPYGTPEDVRREVKRVIEILAPGGGYMLAAVHTIMDDVPAENILAMVDAALTYGRYPVGRT